MRVALIDTNEAESNSDDDAKFGGRKIDNLRFADDIAPLSKTLKGAQELLKKVDCESSRYGQEISQTKTE